jgi:hypothetical protein
MKESSLIKEGDVVYFTKHYAEWMLEGNPNLDLSLIHRIARVAKIMDWETEEGKLILAEREKTRKWGNLDSKSFCYVLKVYFPEIIGGKSKESGIASYEVLPLNYPGTDFPMFAEYPKKILEELTGDNFDNPFKVEQKEG